MQAESSTESARRSSAVLFDNPAYSAQASPDRASTADSGLRRSRQDANTGTASLLGFYVLGCSSHGQVVAHKIPVVGRADNVNRQLAQLCSLRLRLSSA